MIKVEQPTVRKRSEILRK